MLVAVRPAVMFAVLLAGSVAFAQPGATPPRVDTPAPVSPQPAGAPPPGAAPIAAPPGTAVYLVPTAPQNQDWNNVSHINGTPVRVGEHDDYLYRWKTTNIASNPIGWLFGFFGLSISQAIHDHIALRGDANWFDIIRSTTSGYEVGASVSVYFRRVFSGPFLEGGVVARTIYRPEEPDDTIAGPEVMFGWHWTYDWGVNVAIAGGAIRALNHSHSDELQPAGYFRIGYAF